MSVTSVCGAPGTEWDAARVAIDPSLSPVPQAERKTEREEG